MKEYDGQVFDRDNVECHFGDMLYNEKGHPYRFSRVVWMQPSTLFKKLFSIGKAGYKVVLTYMNEPYDRIYVDIESIAEEFSHTNPKPKKEKRHGLHI